MLMPSIFGESLFDDWFDDFDRQMQHMDHRLYGRNAKREMKTDVREKEDGYEIDMDLPGFKKDQVELSLENGYLTVTANKGFDRDQKDDQGRMIRQERYAGSMQRSFYVGRAMTVEDVKARFEDGVLHLHLPKKDAQLPARKTICIEG
ncbi:MAG: Hsp20/alpha crystallin family protein [Clostridia bacterium]|nr:Hsp20/alpha crystallin family protein [Clostridia bacterium]